MAARTERPASTSRRAMALPTTPVAPVSSTSAIAHSQSPINTNGAQ